MRDLAWIEKLVAHPDRRLPANVWADRQIRAFVPARYVLAVDRAYSDLSKLPAPARRVLVQLQEAQAPRVSDPDDGASTGAPSDLRAFGLGGLRNPSDLHLTLALPDTRC